MINRAILLHLGVLFTLLLAACGTPTPTEVAEVTRTAGPATEVPAPTPVPTAAPTAMPPTETPIPEPTWTSWAAGNTIYALIASGDELISGGPGGVTVWAADGNLARRYTSGNGLPNPYVQALHADEDGTLWVGTDGGVARLRSDGSSTTFSTVDGLDSNSVRAIARVRDELWIGTFYSDVEGGGLMRFVDGSWQAVRGFPSANSDRRPGRLSFNVTSIVEDKAGNLWVGTTNGLGRFDGVEWTRFSTTEGLPSKAISMLYLDRNGLIWAGTTGGAARFDGKQFNTFRQLQNALGGGVYGITQDAAGRFWFSGSGGLLRFDAANSDWERFDQNVNDLPAYVMTRALLMKDTVFFGSDGGGLARFDGSDFATWAVLNVPSFPGLRRIVPRPGTSELWFVEESWVRADRLDTATGEWRRAPDLPCDGCGPLTFDSAGALWAGSERGLYIINGVDVTQWTTEFGLPSNTVPFVALGAEGQAWLATGGGVALVEGTAVAQVFTDSVGLAGNYIRRVFLASDGALWAATEANLSRRAADGTWQHFGAGDPFNYAVVVNDLAEDASGAVWVATNGDSVYRYAEGKWQAFQPNAPGVKLPSGNVFSVAVAPNGDLWFGTDSGAARLSNGEWSSVLVKDGLINARVLDLYVDEGGAVWFATGGGVSRYGP